MHELLENFDRVLGLMLDGYLARLHELRVAVLPFVVRLPVYPYLLARDAYDPVVLPVVLDK